MGKILSHPVTMIIISLVAVVFVISLRKNTQKTDVSRQTTQSLETEVSQLSAEVIGLQNRQAQVDSEFYKEQLIRNELLMQKEGEYVLKIVLPEETPPISVPEDTPTTPKQKWFSLLF